MSKPKIDTKIKVRSVVETTKQHSIAISGEQIVLALRKSGVKVPYGATVQFVVPGGGDWSGSAIDVDRR